VSASHRVVAETLAFVERHGYALLFLWILAEQSALPLPSAPLLLAAGALIRMGRMHAVPALASCALAALIADTVWYQLGKRFGGRIVRLVCRVSLEPDSCVRQTENAFVKFGLNSLLVAKFIPGVNSVTAPLAGSARSPYWRFVLYDAAGVCIWSGSYLAAGYVFSAQLETLFGYGARMGSGLFLLVIGLLASWIAWKFIQRRRFLRKLAMARITPEELRERLDAGEEVLMVDLRTYLPAQTIIPGAIRIAPEELAAHGASLPRDREIVLFCS
jgi:membrane protein DedA with SNARE-associated domain